MCNTQSQDLEKISEKDFVALRRGWRLSSHELRKCFGSHLHESDGSPMFLLVKRTFAKLLLQNAEGQPDRIGPSQTAFLSRVIYPLDSGP
jgi:hypothetical protein